MHDLLTDEQTHPVVLLKALTQKYGSDCLTWMPSVLKKTLERDHGINIARINASKFLAAASIAANDAFWHEWEHFHFLCQSLNNNTPTHEELQELSPSQIVNAMHISRHIREDLGQLSHVPEFNEEVARYIAANLLFHGVWYLPPPYDAANKHMSKRWYRCRDCGNEDEVRFDDGLCDFCIDRWNTDQLENWDPNPRLVAKGYGKNIEIFEKNPADKVKKRLQEAMKSNIVLQETPEDICVARVLTALQYIDKRQAQLRKGLERLYR